MSRFIKSAFALVGVIGLAGCPKGKPVDVAPIAAADQTIAENESQLIGQRGVLQREQKKLAEARAELVDRRKQLGTDSTAQAALDDQERKLFVREDELTAQQSAISGKHRRGFCGSAASWSSA